MREELIRLLQERVQLDRQKAEQAVDVVMEYAKQHSSQILQAVGQQGGIGKIFGG